jgi:hypothetical protein
LSVACVGCATASQSGRLPYAAEHGTKETRSYAPWVLRTTLKQTLMRSPSLNGHPAASRVSETTWRGWFVGIVIFLAGTSQHAKLRPSRPSASPLGCSCRAACALCGGAIDLRKLLTKVVAGQPLHDQGTPSPRLRAQEDSINVISHICSRFL